MRLVMGGESLEGQLTGIGQYTYNLAKELRKHPDIEDFKFQSHGRLLEPDSLMADHSPDSINDTNNSPAPSRTNKLLGRVRSIAAQNSTAVAVYERLMPWLEKRSLRGYGREDVYHSPNYLLPAFPGKRVVSILDLSTYRFPEQHPDARVRFVNANIQKALQHADHIITISNVVKNEIIERFQYPEEKITVTYLGASSTFRPYTKNEFEDATHEFALHYKGYFLFVSSIEPRKNLERLLDAYLAYRAECSGEPLPLIIAGTPGWKSEHIHARLEQLAAQGDVRYLGYVPQELLPALIAGAKALLYPSLYEGFGLPVLEAMQSGTAVMTSKSTAMAEIGEKAVIQIDPQSIDAMAGALLRIAQDDAAVSTIEKHGLDAAQQFNWRRCAEQTFSAYQSVLT